MTSVHLNSLYWYSMVCLFLVGVRLKGRSFMGKIYTTDESSSAKGNPTRSSDIDIVIDSKGRIRGIDFFSVLEDIMEALDIPPDLIEASQIIDGGRAQREIAETGVVIYERTR